MKTLHYSLVIFPSKWDLHHGDWNLIDHAVVIPRRKYNASNSNCLLSTRDQNQRTNDNNGWREHKPHRFKIGCKQSPRNYFGHLSQHVPGYVLFPSSSCPSWLESTGWATQLHTMKAKLLSTSLVEGPNPSKWTINHPHPSISHTNWE